MNSRFTAFVSALALVLSGTVAQAALVTLSTSDLAGIGLPSSLGINLGTADGSLQIPPSLEDPDTGDLTLQFITGSLSGTVIADLNLDGTNSGTATIISSSLTLSPLNYSIGQAGIFLFEISSTPIDIALTATSLTVTNGLFSLDNTNGGSLALVGGTLFYNVDIPGLFTGSGSQDFTASPTSVLFSALTTSLPGYANISGPDASLGVSFAGASSSVDLSGLSLVITLDGGLNTYGAAIPEVGSTLLVGMASLAGLGFIARRRRNV